MKYSNSFINAIQDTSRNINAESDSSRKRLLKYNSLTKGRLLSEGLNESLIKPILTLTRGVSPNMLFSTNLTRNYQIEDSHFSIPTTIVDLFCEMIF